MLGLDHLSFPGFVVFHNRPRECVSYDVLSAGDVGEMEFVIPQDFIPPGATLGIFLHVRPPSEVLRVGEDVDLDSIAEDL